MATAAEAAARESLTALLATLEADSIARTSAWPADPDERCPNGCGHLACCTCGCCGGGE